MSKKIIIIIFTVLLFAKAAFPQSHFPTQLVGVWINAEYEQILTGKQNGKMSGLVSPQFLYFDSLGICTIQTRIEHKVSIGKPVINRMFGDVFQFTYTINKSTVAVNSIEDNSNFLCITFSGVPVSMVFKRYIL